MPAPPPGVAAVRAAGTVIAVPDPIPHTLDGREDCFTCHAIGAVDAPAIPADHEDEVTLCTTCHAVWLAPVIVGATPPVIPHSVQDRGDCLSCHKLGTAGAPRIPDNHDGLAGDICRTCHTQVAEITGGGEEEIPVAGIPSIPHALEGFSACTSCHAEGGSGVPRMPEDHEGRTDDICLACHKLAEQISEMAPTRAPESPTAETPTTVTGDPADGEALYGEKCAICHGPAGEGTAIVAEPIDDDDLLDEFSDEDLITTIREGIEGKMPAQPDLDDQELLNLVAFIRSWQ